MNPGRQVSTTYGPRSKYIPHEAADVLANETYRYMFKRAGMPKLGGIFVGQEDTASPIIRAIHGATWSIVARYLMWCSTNKRMLEEDPKAIPSRFIRAKI